MAIRQIKKELELPPSHLYLEDIESIIIILRSAVMERGRGNNEEPRIRFEIGKRKECDSLDDLKKVGGRWRNFRMTVGDMSLSFTIYQTHFLSSNAEVFNRLLQISMIRVMPLRAFLRRINYWAFLAWLYVLLALTGVTWSRKPLLVVVVMLLILTVVLSLWALSAYTIVELRYSHEPSPKLTWLKDRAEKAVWLVVGTFLTLLVQWLWKHFMK